MPDFAFTENGVAVAAIKKDYIDNIIASAKKCASIDRVILFGSVSDGRCTETSDIDIALFGQKKERDFLRSEDYKTFHRQVVSFDESYRQDYDILYFSADSHSSEHLMKNIMNGKVLYQKNAD